MRIHNEEARCRAGRKGGKGFRGSTARGSRRRRTLSARPRGPPSSIRCADDPVGREARGGGSTSCARVDRLREHAHLGFPGRGSPVRLGSRRTCRCPLTRRPRRCALLLTRSSLPRGRCARSGRCGGTTPACAAAPACASPCGARARVLEGIGGDGRDEALGGESEEAFPVGGRRA